MTNENNPLPPQYPGVTAYLVVKGAAEAMEFYKSVFGAEEVLRLTAPDGVVCHAELRIGGGAFMLAEEVPDMDIKAPPTIGGSPVGLMFYTQDPDAMFEAAINAGAKEFKPVCDQFYGERSGTVDDPFGHRWTISSRTEGISLDEVAKRFQDFYGDD